MSECPGSNRGPPRPKRGALPTEPHSGYIFYIKCLFLNAIPEPVFKYFSNLIDLLISLNDIKATSLHSNHHLKV